MALTVAEFDYVRALMRQHAAIVLEPEKSYRAESALQPLARQEGFETVAELVRSLQSGAAGPVHRRAVEAMTINETSFFRDIYPFEALRDAVLPGMMRRRGGDRRLGIWCAACSTGQEPYSVAMTVRDQVPELAGWDVRILATDLSGAAVVAARAGRYRQAEVNRGLPAAMLVRHFTRHGLEWQVSDELRRMVTFEQANLVGAWPAAGWRIDVVLLRNVLIYFDVPTKRSILERARALLGPGGALILGGAETTLQLCNGFERVGYGRHAWYHALSDAEIGGAP
jgi:chemotaxis protein methyltransferase CheR